jgi:putative MATE family efflux protein
MNDNELISAPIKSLVGKIALPAVIGFFFNTMYNVVDTYFGGRISTEALAALSLSFPVFFIIISFDSGIGNGTSAIITNALGAGKKEEAKEYVAQSITFGLILSVIVTCVGLLIAPFLFKTLGATGNYLGLAVSYIDTIFYGTFFFLMISVMNSVVQSGGNTRVYRNFLIIGFLLNLVLNPLFIYGTLGIKGIGFAGIAWATVVTEAIGFLYLTRAAIKTGLVPTDSFSHYKPKWKKFKELAAQVFPATLNMVTVGLGILIITYFISRFGPDAVAAYGIATRVEQISLVPSIGLIIAALTLIGQNNGAGRMDRVKEALRVVIRYGLSIMTVGGILVFFLAHALMAFFTTNENVIRIGTEYLHIAVFIFWAYIILFTSTSALQGLKRPMYAVWIGLYRQILAPLFIFEILVAKFSMGLYGVWWGVFIVTWSAAIVTAFYLRYVLAKIKQPA